MKYGYDRGIDRRPSHGCQRQTVETWHCGRTNTDIELDQFPTGYIQKRRLGMLHVSTKQQM